MIADVLPDEAFMNSESRLQPPRKEPVVRIRPSGRWPALNLKDIWVYRELFFFLVWRDLKVRYRQTLLGVAWVVIQPLLTMIVFAFLFGRIVGVPSDGIPYPLFAITGLVPWGFFASAVTRGGSSVVGSAHLITKVYFPRLIIPSAAVAAGLLDLAISFLLVVVMFLVYGRTPSTGIVLLPLLVALTVLLALGIAFLTSGLNVKYRDVGQLLPFLVQIGMFATPIIYPLSMAGKWRWLLMLNPMTGIIEGFRSALFGLRLNVEALGISVAITFLLLVFAAFAFRRVEKDFADIV